MNGSNQQNMIALLKKEVKPALGCTEPIAVALAAALVKQRMKQTPETLQIYLSGNILKNGMGVGIPGTGKTGLYIAAALGFVGGNAAAELEVLKDITAEHLLSAEQLVNEGKIKIKTKDVTEKLYIEVIGQNREETSSVIISGNHTNVILIKYNDEVIMEKACPHEKETDTANDTTEETFKLSVEKIFNFAVEAPFEEIEFILEGARMNKAIAREGLLNDYGLMVGKTIQSNIRKGIFHDDISTYAMALTAAASDARMGGCVLPVMSNTGSGNQGLSITLPIIAAAEKLEANEEQLARALVIGNLLSIHAKQYLGRLAALCGVVTACGAASAAITYLLGGTCTNTVYALKNVIGNIAGMVCDGAKPGCAMKVSTGASAAIQAAYMAMDNIVISDNDGIIEKDIEKTIKNLTRMGSEGMTETDKMILEIMVCK